MERTLDRRVSFDERSRNYPIRALIAPKVPRSYTWRCKVNLDQGTEGACTGFSVTHEAAARPVEILSVTNATALEVYHRARQLDEWPGEDYEGSSVLGAMKAGKERGWYDEYRWAFGEEDLALAVSYKGPSVLGINWYEGMFAPDAEGYVHVSGRLAGGHAILCNGYHARTRTYRLHNSWGPAWGVGGDCFISADDLSRLLHEQGEACIPVKRTKPKA
jgi:hypothetical protein